MTTYAIDSSTRIDYIGGYQSNGEQITLITESFDDSIRGVLD